MDHPELVAKIARVVFEARAEARVHEVRLYRPEGTEVDDEA